MQTKLIKKITVQDISEESHYTEILNKLTGADACWIKNKLMRIASEKSSVCMYELYFHEYNSELAKLVAELKAASQKAVETGDDSKMEATIKKITRFKVIAVLNWTC